MAICYEKRPPSTAHCRPVAPAQSPRNGSAPRPRIVLARGRYSVSSDAPLFTGLESLSKTAAEPAPAASVAPVAAPAAAPAAAALAPPAPAIDAAVKQAADAVLEKPDAGV